MENFRWVYPSKGIQFIGKAGNMLIKPKWMEGLDSETNADLIRLF